MSNPHIRAAGISKFYSVSGGADVTALDHVSLEIANGERVGIVGSNGAGKSTLLQIIAGVSTPTSGTLTVEGGVHAILTVGLGLREEATGRENLFLDGALLGKTRDMVEAHLQEMIDFAELGDFIDKPVRTYSSGMKARLAFASLAHIDPEILIIDEALSVGDAFFAAKATRMIEKLCERGRIVLVVSHSINSIKSMCQRCIWLEGGKVKADGPSALVGDAYAAATRARQEAEIQRKFGASGKAWSREPSFALSNPRVVRSSDGVETALLEAGVKATLRVTLTLSRRAAPDAKLRIWIESNDGLPLADEWIPLGPPNSEIGVHEIGIDLGPVDWRPFLYQAHIELRQHGKAVAHVAVTFQVFSDSQIFGGNPLLRTPPQVRVLEP